MQNLKLKDFIEYAGGIAVLLGLLLVVMELRQSNEHAKAESIRAIYLGWATISQFESEYQIDMLVAKAAIKPKQLTDQELYRLDDYYSLVMNNIIMRAVMQREGGLVFANILEEGPQIVDDYFYYPLAQDWLKAFGGWIERDAPELHSKLMLAVEQSEVSNGDVWVDRWQSAWPSTP